MRKYHHYNVYMTNYDGELLYFSLPQSVPINSSTCLWFNAPLFLFLFFLLSLNKLDVLET